MNVQQKAAWYDLAVFGASVIFYLALVLVVHHPPLPALGAFGLCGLWGLKGFYYTMRRGAVILDERDRLVSVRAQLVGLWIFWVAFVLVCTVTWGVLRYEKREYTVPVDVLPIMVFGGLIIYSVSHSVAVLVQYGRTSRESE
jgi:hypothetical protein